MLTGNALADAGEIAAESAPLDSTKATGRSSEFETRAMAVLSHFGQRLVLSVRPSRHLPFRQDQLQRS